MSEIPQYFLYAFFFMSLYLEIFFIVVFFETRSAEKLRMAKAARNAKLPSATIIVPCYNEEKTVAKTIQSLLDLTYPKHLFNIIVVDDGSTDNTFAIAKKFETRKNVRVLKKENGGKHTALNLGIAQSNTDLVGCLDADSFVEPNALREMVRAFENPKVAAATPAIKIFRPKEIVRKLQKVEYEMSVFLRRIFGGLDALYVTPGPFSLFRREIFSTLGPFRKAHNTEDMEYAMRLQAHHHKIANVSSAHVYTVGPKTLPGLYRQRRRWVTGFLRNVWDYRFFLFNKNHGSLGFLILPAAVFSIFAGLYMAAYAFISFVSYFIEKLDLWQAINYKLYFGNATLDWFYINTHTVSFLTAILLILWGVSVMIGRRLTGESVRPTFDLLYFLLLYGFVAPLWLFASVYNAIFRIERSWK